MPVFSISVDTGDSEPSVTALADGLGGLSKEFDQLQRSMAAQEKLAARVKAGEDAQLKSIQDMQKAALAGHDQTRDAELGRAKDVAQRIADEQKEALAQQKAEAERMRAIEEHQQKVSELTSWIGNLREGTSKWDEALNGAREQLIGIWNVAAPVVAALTVVAGAIGALMGKAIMATQAKDAMRALLGPETLEMVEALSQKLPYTADQLGAWAESLKTAGYEGDRLKTALQAVAASAAIKRDGGAAAEALLQRLKMAADVGNKITLDTRFLKQIAAAGVRVEDLAKALGVPVEKLKTMTLTADKLGAAIQTALIAKGAPALAQLGQTWDVIKAKVLEGIDDAFEDLGDLVHPFMVQVQSLFAEFFKGSVASKGLAGVVHGVLSVAFEVATRTVRALHIAFLYLEIALLHVYIAAHPLTSALQKLGVSGGIVNVAMYLVAGTAITLAVVFGVLALAVALVALPFVLAAVAIYAMAKAAMWLWSTIGEGLSYLQGLQDAATQAGVNMILGLGNAISSGAAWVVGLVKNLASSIIAGITSTLQIKSPSRVMAQLGGYTVAGLAEGIEGGQDDVEDASQGAARAAVRGASRGGAAGGRGGAPVSLTIAPGAVVVNADGQPAERVREMVEEAFALLLERLQLAQGT